MKITIARIVKSKPSKFGFNVHATSKEDGDMKIYMIPTKNVESLKPNDVIEGESKLWNKGDNGIEYWTWEWPKKEDKIGGKLELILNNQARMLLMLQQIGQSVIPRANTVSGTDIPYPEEEIDADAIDQAFEDYSKLPQDE